jgi:hypothetical protein
VLKNLVCWNISDFQQMSFWTSASSEGQNCALERKLAWCTTGTIIEEILINDAQLWTTPPYGNESAGNCVAMSLTNNETITQLSLAACTESKSYMCQVF